MRERQLPDLGMDVCLAGLEIASELQGRRRSLVHSPHRHREQEAREVGDEENSDGGRVRLDPG